MSNMKKRAITLFLISTFLLSMIPVFPVKAAIQKPEAFSSDGTLNITGVVGYTKVGTKLIVNGTGVTSGNTINVYWDYVLPAYLLNATDGNPDGSYECTIIVPETINSTHYIWVKDADSVTIDTASSTGIKIWSKLTLSPAKGLPDDVVTVTGKGFKASTKYFLHLNKTSDTNLTTATSNAKGTYTSTFTIPTLSYAKYLVNSTDVLNASDVLADLSVGASLVADISKGDAGDIVKLTGRGWNPGFWLTGNVTFNRTGASVNKTMAISSGDTVASSTGGFVTYVVIPSNGTGNYKIQVQDRAGNVTTVSFELVNPTKVTVTPQYGTPGNPITITGQHYTNIAGVDVDVYVYTTLVGTADTAADGSWTLAATVPALGLGTAYTLYGLDDNNLNATTNFRIALYSSSLSKSPVQVGDAVTLSVSGFEPNTDVNASLAGKTIMVTTSTNALSYFSHTFYVPTLAAGTHTIEVWDIDNEILITTTITVTDQAAITITPASAPLGYNVTIKGVNFANVINVATKWAIYNTTWYSELTDNVTYLTVNPVTLANGSFTAYMKLGTSLELGSYTLRCNTTQNPTYSKIVQVATTTLNVVEEALDISLRSAAYYRGDTISYIIKSTFIKSGSTMEIKDPDGYRYFYSNYTAWLKVGDWWTVPVDKQITTGGHVYEIPIDATLGTWTWAMKDGSKTVASGTFTVSDRPTTDTADVEAQITELTENVNTQITAVNSAIDSLGALVDGLEASIAGVSGDVAGVKSDIAALETAIDAAKDAANAATAAVEDIAADATGAKASAEAAKTAAEAASDAANGLTTLVYGAIAASLIAALAAIVSLMQISRRIAG